MVHTRRRFMSKSVGLCGSATVGLLAPQLAFADCSKDQKVLSFTPVSPGKKQVVIPPWHVGDCWMENGVVMIRNDGHGEFGCRVRTLFTHTKDVWHLTLEILGEVITDPGGASFSGSWDGPKMSEKDKPVQHLWGQNFAFDAAKFEAMKHVRLTSCC